SRRRHTRFSRDWSSDVCSSDLPELFKTKHLQGHQGMQTSNAMGTIKNDVRARIQFIFCTILNLTQRDEFTVFDSRFFVFFGLPKIGRASCREKWRYRGSSCQ